jgi:hypothetical protein
VRIIFSKSSPDTCSFWLLYFQFQKNLLDMPGQDEIGFFWFFLSINRTEPKLVGLNWFWF